MKTPIGMTDFERDQRDRERRLRNTFCVLLVLALVSPLVVLALTGGGAP